MPRLFLQAEVLARIVVHHDGHVDAILEIALDRFDDRRLALQHHVENVGPAQRPQTHGIAGLQFDVADADTLQHLPPVGFRHFVHVATSCRRWGNRMHHAVQPAELPAVQRFRACQQGPHALIQTGGLASFFLGQRQDAQAQDLVDLGAVEKIARALRRDLRIIVKNDRSGQHGIAARPARPPARARRRCSGTISASSRAAAGGSISDRNSPFSAFRMTCVDTRLRISA